jgi:hypothetical protein
MAGDREPFGLERGTQLISAGVGVVLVALSILLAFTRTSARLYGEPLHCPSLAFPGGRTFGSDQCYAALQARSVAVGALLIVGVSLCAFAAAWAHGRRLDEPYMSELFKEAAITSLKVGAAVTVLFTIAMLVEFSFFRPVN